MATLVVAEVSGLVVPVATVSHCEVPVVTKSRSETVCARPLLCDRKMKVKVSLP